MRKGVIMQNIEGFVLAQLYGIDHCTSSHIHRKLREMKELDWLNIQPKDVSQNLQKLKKANKVEILNRRLWRVKISQPLTITTGC